MPQYFQFWIVLITVPNLIVIAVMLVFFALLLLVPIPRFLDATPAHARESVPDSVPDQQEVQS